MALSVDRGFLMMVNMFMLDSFFTLFFKTLLFLWRARVLGSLKVTLFHTFAFLVVCTPFLTAVAALPATFFYYKKHSYNMNALVEPFSSMDHEGRDYVTR